MHISRGDTKYFSQISRMTAGSGFAGCTPSSVKTSSNRSPIPSPERQIPVTSGKSVVTTKSKKPHLRRDMSVSRRFLQVGTTFPSAANSQKSAFISSAVTDAPLSGKRRRTICAICAYVPAQSTPSLCMPPSVSPTASLSAAARCGAPRRAESAAKALSATGAQNGANCMSVPSLSNNTARIRRRPPCRRTRR